MTTPTHCCSCSRCKPSPFAPHTVNLCRDCSEALAEVRADMRAEMLAEVAQEETE